MPAPILPATNPRDGRPLDLSFSVLRSVSPIHLEYLRNMGVAASMSLSLILGGRLWGLIACHHPAPRFLPHRLRMACELFAQVASWRLETLVAGEDFAAQLHGKRVHEDLIQAISREADLAEGLTRQGPNLLDYIPADGVGLWSRRPVYAARPHAGRGAGRRPGRLAEPDRGRGRVLHRPAAAALSSGRGVRRCRQRPDRAVGVEDAARLRAVVPPGGDPDRHLGRQPEQADGDRPRRRSPDPAQELRCLA